MAELTEEQKRALESVQAGMPAGQGASKLSAQQIAAILSVSPQQTRGQQLIDVLHRSIDVAT